MKRIILPALFVLAFYSFAPGQPAPPGNPAPNLERLLPVDESYGLFQVDASYDYASAYAGGNVRLEITVTTPGQKNIEVVECAPESLSAPLTIVENGSKKEDGSQLLVTKYFYNVAIYPSAEARPYSIKLGLQYEKDAKVPYKVVYRYFDLKVGVRSKGKLSVVQDDELDEPTFYTGEVSSYRLTLRNDFPDYTINIKKISVESVPDDLVTFNDNALAETPISLKPSEQKKVTLNFKINGMNFTKLISGFGERPSIRLAVTYDDGYKREISDFTHKLKIKVRPRDSVLVMAMFAGVLLGVVIRYYLDKKNAPRKRYALREWLKFALYTGLFGLVIATLALLGKIEMGAIKSYGSYDKPLAIFIIGVLAAVCGYQLFILWFRSFVPATGEKKAKAAGEEKPRPRVRRRKRETTQEP